MNKMLATIKAIDDKAASAGAFEAILSMPTKDRDGEIVDAGAFDPLPARINIDVDHAMTVEKTVGSGVPFYDGDVLKIKGTFASTQLGQEVRTLVTEGHIDSLSVAYMNSVYEVDKKDGLPHLRKAELLNAGIVGIGSNREALMTMAKHYATVAEEIEQVVQEKSGARHSSGDLAHIQAAHDALSALGAECGTKSHQIEAVPAIEEPTETQAKAPSAPVVSTPAEPALTAVDVATAHQRRVRLLESELAL